MDEWNTFCSNDSQGTFTLTLRLELEPVEIVDPAVVRFDDLDVVDPREHMLLEVHHPKPSYSLVRYVSY